MIAVFLAIIGVVLTVFFEHIFLGLFEFSIFLLIVVNIWNKGDIKVFLLFTILTGIVLDTTLHMPFGFNIFLSGIVLFLLSFLQIVLPLERPNVRYVALFFVFFFTYLLRFVLLSVLQDSILPDITWSYILNFVLNSAFSVLICVLFDRIFHSLRDSNNYEKIRLR